MGGVVARVFLITIIPLSIGMYLRARSPERVQEIQGRGQAGGARRVPGGGGRSGGSEFDKIVDNFTSVAAAALTLNVLAMTVSYSVARLASLDDRQSTAISMELGVHNSTLAITVASSVSTELAIPAAVYSAFMFITAGAFARVMYRRNRRRRSRRREYDAARERRGSARRRGRRCERPGLAEEAIAYFRHYYRQLVAGEEGVVHESEIEPVEELPAVEDLEMDEAVGREALDRTVILKLNGGLGTSMGLDRAKSLLEVKDGLRFLDVIAQQTLDLRRAGRGPGCPWCS